MRGSSQAEIQSQIDFASFLNDRNFPAAVPITDVIEANGFMASIWKAIPDSGEQATPRKLGGFIRELHNALIEYPGELKEWDQIDSCKKYIQKHKDEESLFSVIQLDILENKLNKFVLKWESKTDRLPVSAIHRDLNLSNIIVDTQGDYHLIDFDYICTGPQEKDLAHRVAAKRASLSKEDIRGLLEGYQLEEKYWSNLEPLASVELLENTLFVASLKETSEVKAEIAKRMLYYDQGIAEAWKPPGNKLLKTLWLVKSLQA